MALSCWTMTDIVENRRYVKVRVFVGFKYDIYLIPNPVFVFQASNGNVN